MRSFYTNGIRYLYFLFLFVYWQPDFIRYAIIDQHDTTKPRGGQIYARIQNYTLHPQWKPSRFPAYDFAIITLEENIVFGQNIQSVNLPSTETLDKSKM